MKKAAGNQTLYNIIHTGLSILVGAFIMACAYPMFFVPCGIAPGGITGIAAIIHHTAGYPVGIVTILLNIPLFILGWRRFGHGFVLRSLAAMFASSALIDLLPLPALTENVLIAAIFGGVLIGTGIGLTIRTGASTGGTDMAAVMIHRRLPDFSVGRILLTLDAVVILAAGVLISIEAALTALITVFVSNLCIDRIVTGFNTARAFLIISRESETISRAILEQLERGVTFLEGSGAYSGASVKPMLSIVSRFQVSQLKNIIQSIDPQAFVISTDVTEVLGEGFSSMSHH